MCGTPEYMSPEQARGEEVDGRSDLYAVGVILYQLVTGELPFTASSPVGILSKHLAEPPLRPTLRAPGLAIPPPFERVILRALAKDADDRPQTAEEMRRELRAPAGGVAEWNVASPGCTPPACLVLAGPAGAADHAHHVAQLAAVSGPPWPRRDAGTVARPARPPGQPGSRVGESVDAVQSSVLAPETVSTRWPRRLGGPDAGHADRRRGAATCGCADRPGGGPAAGRERPAAAPAVTAPREAGRAPPPGAPAGRGQRRHRRARRRRRPAGRPRAAAAAAPPAAAEARAPEPDARAPGHQAQPGGRPRPLSADRREPAGEARRAPPRGRRLPEPAPIASAPARTPTAAPATAADP